MRFILSPTISIFIYELSIWTFSFVTFTKPEISIPFNVSFTIELLIVKLL